MRKFLTLFSIILCSSHLHAQLPVIPVPQSGTLGTYGTTINPRPPSNPFSPSFKRDQQNDVYDSNELIRRKQRVQQEINEAVFKIREVSIDPHCEKYYSISPYAYCMNNPVRFIDPDGKDVAILIAKDGAGERGTWGQ